MGCFSWLCKDCGKGIQSTSFNGEQCLLFLLKDGKVIDKMEGEYDSYGAVFIPGSQNPEVEHKLPLSFEWVDAFPDRPRENKYDDIWRRVCELLFRDGESSGMAAYHKRCYKGDIPTTKSLDDPNQGWGNDGELLFKTDHDFDD